MKIEQIEVTIGPDGKIKMQTTGFSGDACLAATEELETLLGSGIIQRERTAETYDPAVIRTAEKASIRR